MKRVFFICLLLIFGIPIINAQKEIITCGDNEALIIDTEKSDSSNVCITWKWEVAEAASQIPAVYQKLLIPLDECKFVDNNSKILLTSSGGAVLLLDRASKKCLFYAQVPMAHSADLLPNNRIVVSLSTHPKGNSIEVFDIAKPEKVLFRDSLYSGHGAVWMASQKRLYVLGFNMIKSYSLKNWTSSNPSLKFERSWKIPVHSGHDMSPVSKNELLVTGHEGVYLFNSQNGRFIPFAPLSNVKDVKSVNFDKKSNYLVYTKAEISWWTHHIYTLNPKRVYSINDINLYKVRATFD